MTTDPTDLSVERIDAIIAGGTNDSDEIGALAKQARRCAVAEEERDHMWKRMMTLKTQLHEEGERATRLQDELDKGNDAYAERDHLKAKLEECQATLRVETARSYQLQRDLQSLSPDSASLRERVKELEAALDIRFEGIVIEANKKILNELREDSRRFQAACAAMTGLLANPNHPVNDPIFAPSAVGNADSLLAALATPPTKDESK